MIEVVLGALPAQYLALAAVAALLAGFVKGAVGFGMPMILISAFGSFMHPQLALATLIVPTLFSNVWQALRDGLGPALVTIRRFRLFMTLLLVFILASAQLAAILPPRILLLIIGIPVTAFAATQLAGWRLSIKPKRRKRAEAILGVLAGLTGGLSGVWGPPTVAYLTAIETPRQESMRTQGIVYGAGSIMLTLAHLHSGLLNAETMPVSISMLAPALLGMAIGFQVSDRLEQHKFRRATLAVLIIAGLNLIRRGAFG